MAPFKTFQRSPGGAFRTLRGQPSVLAGHAIAGEVARRVLTRVLTRCEQGLRAEDVLYETVYQEEQRLARAEPDLRSEADREFLAQLRRDMGRAVSADARRELLFSVVTRYTQEISGYFDPRVYQVATRALPPMLGALLHGGRPGPRLFEVRDRILLEGDVAGLRAAVQRGTVVLVPTHVSNLDSLVLGYAIYALGLPPFAYGAGLNLFTSALTGFFMRNLGAFTVDRSKTDPLYRDTIKEYATLLLERGQHTLFFPGGTRSRAGAVESRLKLGFLGTAVRAFAHAQVRGNPRPVYIVPCTLSYPLVLEASTLITDYLRAEGGPHYLEVRDEFERPTRWVDFLSGLAELDLCMHVRFGTPIDVLGYPVDREGISRDHRGRPIEPRRYFLGEGGAVEDEARDAEYTRMLAKRLLADYRRGTVALPSSVLAYVLFEHLQRAHPQRDIFRLLRVLGPQLTVSSDELLPELTRALDGLRGLSAGGELVLGPALATRDAEQVLRQGAATLSMYHRAPVLTVEGTLLRVGDPALLFYYRNRLDGYGLLGAPSLKAWSSRRFERVAS